MKGYALLGADELGIGFAGITLADQLGERGPFSFVFLFAISRGMLLFICRPPS
jgi:hypothetical protein